MKYLNCANDLHKEALHFSLECQPRFEASDCFTILLLKKKQDFSLLDRIGREFLMEENLASDHKETELGSHVCPAGTCSAGWIQNGGCLKGEVYRAIQDCSFLRPIPHVSWKVGFSYEFEKLLVSDDTKSFKDHEFIDQCTEHVPQVLKLLSHWYTRSTWPRLIPRSIKVFWHGVTDQSISVFRLQVIWTDGCDMEFTKGYWSVAEDIGGWNSDQKKENVGICMLRPDGNHAIRRALNEFYAEPAKKSIQTVVSPVLTGDSCFVLLWSPITIKGQCQFDIQVLNFCEKVRERQEQQEEISMSAISESLQIPSTCCYTPLLG
ncbi:hypothetical protein RHSIM_Rhsim09G0014800 [Rhododendron simsii]|uniref:Uncharacterized protein n=1 Tax=Rhododendron simsii TaxID=118357 RepID=A0A834GDK5_RHOSS|nr:hypothetical protein RHSIM_Rhsim09G0014800 [Rhododendron simsii]